MLAALLDPQSFFNSLAASTQPIIYTPQIWSLYCMYIASMTFSGIIEPAIVYTALYRLESVRDAQTVLEVLEGAMAAFDVMHSLAVWAVVGFDVVRDFYAAVHFWVPVGFFVVRTMWFLYQRRQTCEKARSE